jgi:endoglucanase
MRRLIMTMTSRDSKWRPLSGSLCALLGISMLLSPLEAAAACWQGVNLAGAEFGKPNGIYGKDYIYPSAETIRYFADKGMNTIRLPFRWEHLQPRLGGPLEKEELSRLKQAVNAIRANGMTVILDPHNYARFNEQPVGTDAVPYSALADFWAKLSAEFANQKKVAFGLMNEPHDIPAENWLIASNGAIAAIRNAGARNLILVPGTTWTGAHSWISGTPDGVNGQVMLGIVDGENNYAYEVHQYLDKDFSGTSDECGRADDAVAALASFTQWLKDNGKRGYLGEFGGSKKQECLVGLARMVDLVNQESSVWTGWTYWAGGDWWPSDEPLNVQPDNQGDRIQLKAILRPGSKADGDTCPALGLK